MSEEVAGPLTMEIITNVIIKFILKTGLLKITFTYPSFLLYDCTTFVSTEGQTAQHYIE